MHSVRHVTLLGLASGALLIAALPAVASTPSSESAPHITTATGSVGSSGAQHDGRECVGDEAEGSVGADHAGEATYFDNVLANPSCSGVPMEMIKGKKCKDGMAGGLFPCDHVNLASFMPLSEMGSTWANDIWGWTDPKTGHEYAIMGVGDGTSFVDVTKAQKPKFLGKLPTHTASSTWRDIKVFDNHAFIISEAPGHGMQVFDLTRLRNVKNPKTFDEDAWLGGFGHAHNIAVDEETGFVYVVGARTGVTACGEKGNGGGGPIMIDVNKPEKPKVAGCIADDGYTHDSQCVVYHGPDSKYVGKEVCINSNEDTITIVDVSDKENPVMLSRTGYGTASYTHQAWLTPDHKYLLSDDELDEEGGKVPSTTTYVWDVRDLDKIELINQFAHGTKSIDHNLYIVRHYAFESNYMSGVRILDTKKVSKGKLSYSGYFDLYPAQDLVDFAGSWSNYPFFKSGTVIATGMEEGLFVLRPTGKIRKALQHG
jgi:choice-of-anchor B domain-containing protein